MIIYQYSEELIIKQGFDYDYLEKYIPFKMNITQLHFTEIIKLELTNKYKDILTDEDFSYLSLQDYRFNVLTEFFDYKSEFNLTLEYISIRKVQHMLAEIYSTLAQKDELRMNYKELVINFYIIKHLLPKQFEKLNIKQTIFESIKFYDGDQAYTILDLIDSEPNNETTDLLTKIFSVEENRESYGILKLLNFELISPTRFPDTERFNQLKQVEKYKHEKMNRIICKLLYEGKSIFTDYENAVQKMCKQVLDKNKDNQLEAFRDYRVVFFQNDRIITDNRTIFLMGVNHFENLYEAFRIAGVEEKYWLKLNEFYFEYRNSNEIDLELLRCLNNCNVYSNRIYLQVINYFSTLNINVNFNKYKDFLIFATKYIDGLNTAKLFASRSYHGIDRLEQTLSIQQKLSIIQETISRLIEELNREIQFQKRIEFRDFEVIYIEIKMFLEKLLELINEPRTYVEDNAPYLNTEITSRYSNQEEYDRIKQLIISEVEINEIKAIILHSYNEGKLSFYESNRLLAEYEEFFL